MTAASRRRTALCNGIVALALRRSVRPYMWIPGLLLLIATFGCSAGEDDRARTARVDTLASGRVIVANTGVPGWSSETAWRLEEDLRLGTIDAGDPEEFSLVMSIVDDARGMIYVLDALYGQIQVFHPDGSFSHTIGSEGEGPGEFIAPRAVAIAPGDTFWVVDDGTVRYSAFASDGTFLESHPRRIMGFYTGASGAFLHDGSYIDWGIGYPEGRQGPRTRFWPIRLGPRFEDTDSLPPLENVLPSGQWPTLPFVGSLTAAVDGKGGIWFAHTEEYRIYRRDLRGDTTLIFSLPAEPPPVGEAEREYIRTQRSGNAARYLRALPETKPIVHRIVPDNAGHIFVFADVAGEPSGTVVDVFRESGEYLGRMGLPTPVPLFPPSLIYPVVYATSEHLYVVVEDELDVPYVSRLRIVKER